jgi:hypothetical protein
MVGTRRLELLTSHRVKGKLTCIPNGFDGVVDQISTSKYL